MQTQTFKTNYLLRILKKDYNPFTPHVLLIDDHMIQHKRRNWFLISVNTQSYHFQNVAGIDVDKGLLGAMITIETTSGSRLKLQGFSKGTANAIREICSQFIVKNSHRSGTEHLASTIVNAMQQSNSGSNVASELKKLKELVDDGIISQQEFETQKHKLLNN